MIGGKIAIWQRAFFDKNKVGTNIEQGKILCVEQSHNVLSYNPTVGVMARECQLILLSDTPRAGQIKPDDLIIWNNHKYSVQTTTNKPNQNGINSFDTYILLK